MTALRKIFVAKDAARTELHDALQLSGCEISVNHAAKGTGVPFVHSHKDNEEVYGILEGQGELYLDGEVSKIKAGDWFVIDPDGHRALKAADDSDMIYICVQVKKGSLGGFTMTDANLCEDKAPWQK